MKKIQYIIIVIFMILIASCEDFLDRPPLDAIGNESYWTTAGDLEKYMLQYYPNFTGHGGTAANQITLSDNKSDNMIVVVPNTLLNGEITTNTGGWTAEWANIRTINIFFNNYLRCEDDFDEYKHFVGEAHFLKAWYYFNLLKKYGDLPWYSEPLYPENEELLMKARDPRTLVADSILANLDKAIEYLDARANADGGNCRLNKETALAFKTRVALYEGTWQKYHSGTEFATAGANPDKYFQACVDAAEELMSGDYTVGLYSTGNSSTDYHSLFGLSNMDNVNEVLFYKAYNVNESVGSNVNIYASNFPGTMGLTWSLITSYLATDGTPYDYLTLSQTQKGNSFLTTIAADCDPRLKSTIWIPGDLQIALTSYYFEHPQIDLAGDELCPTGFQYKKYSNPNSSFDTKGLCETGRIFFRYAEVLLNYAEALYELNGTVAYTALNQIRARVGMPDFTINSQASDPNLIDYGYSISDELYEIRRERRVETPLEEMREDDLKRWAAHALVVGKRFKGYPFDASEFPSYNPSLDANGLIDYHQIQLPDGYQFRPGQDYLSNIPQTEITLNPNLSQNPGW